MLCSVTNQPRFAQTHLRADYVELLCLLHPDNQISQDDVLSFYQNSKDTNQNIEVEEDLEIDAYEFVRMDSASQNDLWFKKAEDWFDHIDYRQHAFGENYPFYLSEGYKVLNLHDELTIMQKLYIYLLLASNLRCMKADASKKLTDSFEYLCALVTQSYLSNKAYVHIFGTSPYNKSGLFSINKPIEKIEKLAQLIQERVIIPEEDKEHFNKGGDAGLDIVAWIPINDDQKGILLLFGQCACTEEWVTKQDSSSYDTWRPLITFTTDPVNTIYFPFFYRKSSGGWHNSTKFRNTIPLDRLRIMHLAETYHSTETSLYKLENLPLSLVDKVITFNSSELFY